VNLIANDVSAAGGALLASPAFTGVPSAPTAAPNTPTTQIATCAYVEAAVLTSGGVLTFNSRAGAVTLTAADVSGVGGALLASPAFTNVPTAPTAAPGSSTTQLATTAFVQAAISAATAGVASFNGRTGAVSLIVTDVTAVLPAATTNPVMDGVASPGTMTAWSRGDHVHPVDTSRYSATNPSNFQTAAQVTASLANYLPLSGGTLTGGLTATGLGSTGNLSVSGSGSVTGGGTYGGVVLQSSAISGSSSGPITVNMSTGVINGCGGLNFNIPGLPSANMGFGWSNAPTGYGSLQAAVSQSSVGYCVRSVAVSGTSFGVTLISLMGTVTQMQCVADGPTTAAWSVAASDGRLKHNLAPPARDALAIVNAVDVSQCEFRHPAAEGSEHWDFTVIAEEVEAVLPYAYMPAPKDGFSGLHPLHLVTVLWKAVQQLTQRLEALEARTA
jgi:hypothetical protein